MLNRSIRAAAVAAALLLFTGCGAKTQSPAFDGQRAFQSLTEQCSFGPRYSGTPGHKAMVEYLLAELKPLADEVIPHKFSARLGSRMLDFTNIYAVFNPDAERFVLLCAHWDTRPTADMEIDSAKKRKPIMGANDGASGVAVLLELARSFQAKKPSVGIVMAFFDGEDYGPSPDRMFLGSTEFAKDWKKAVKPGGREISYDYGILLDMVGDRDLQIYRERFSNQAAPAIVDKVWKAASEMGHDKVFIDEERHMVNDDHVPLLAAGIKCIDVIDFDYAHWHTLDDTVDKCSAESLKVVGEVIGKVIYDEGSQGR